MATKHPVTTTRLLTASAFLLLSLTFLINLTTTFRHNHPPPPCLFPSLASVPLPPAPSPPPSKIHYTKVPKTGSTTVSALLRRYCAHRHLRAGSPNGHAAARVARAWRGVVDATVTHTVYNQTAVDRVLVGGRVWKRDGARAAARRVFRVVSVREPGVRMASAYYYGVAISRRNGAVGEEGGGGGEAEGRGRDDGGARGGDGGGDRAFCCPELVGDVARWVDECEFPVQQVEYAAPVDWPEKRRRAAGEVLRHYDHVMVTDAMMRSIMTLAPKLGLTLEEMIVVSQKYGKRETYMEDERGDAELRARIAGKLATEKMKRERDFYDAAVRRLDAEWAALPEEFRAAEADLNHITDYLSNEQVCKARDKQDNFDECIRRWVKAHVRCAR